LIKSPNIKLYANQKLTTEHKFQILNLKYKLSKCNKPNVKTPKPNRNYPEVTTTKHIKSTHAPATSGTTLNITHTAVNLSSIHLYQDSFQMNPLRRPLRNHTTGHHNIDMVSDTTQPSCQLQVPLLSVLLNNNLIKGLLLWLPRDINILVWKNPARMRDEIKQSDVALVRLHTLNYRLPQLLRGQLMTSMARVAVTDLS